MDSNQPPGEVQEPALDVFKSMFRAVELVHERLNRACETLRSARLPYAVIGGNAVAAWVAMVDDGAVRNTRDVDLLLEEADLPRATAALEQAGFVRDQVMDTIIFVDGPAGKPRQGLRILLAGRKVKNEYATAPPPRGAVRRAQSKADCRAGSAGGNENEQLPRQRSNTFKGVDSGGDAQS